MSASISVREILEVHANIQAMQKDLATQAEAIRRKDRELELLRWKLRGAEEMCLLARFSEIAFQTFTDHTMVLQRNRILLGNHFYALQQAAHHSSVASLRGELKTYRDNVRGGDERIATLADANQSLEDSLATYKHSVVALKQRVSELEKEVATGKLSSFYEDEISSRERLIESLREHNAQLMAVLKKPSADTNAGHGNAAVTDTFLRSPPPPVSSPSTTLLSASPATVGTTAHSSVLLGAKGGSALITSPSLNGGGYRPPFSTGSSAAGAHRGVESARRPVSPAKGAWSAARR